MERRPAERVHPRRPDLRRRPGPLRSRTRRRPPRRGDRRRARGSRPSCAATPESAAATPGRPGNCGESAGAEVRLPLRARRAGRRRWPSSAPRCTRWKARRSPTASSSSPAAASPRSAAPTRRCRPTPSASTRSGKQLWPSLIHLNTVLGISEIDSVPGTVDVAETGDINADADSAGGGERRQHPLPRGALGRHQPCAGGAGRRARRRHDHAAAHRRLDLGVDERGAPALAGAALARAAAAAVRDVLGPPKTPAEARKDAEDRVEKLDKLLDSAEAYGRAKQQAESKGGKWDYDAQLEALQPVVRGERPLWATAREKAAIVAVVDWAAKRKLRLVITDGRDSYLVTDLLAKHQVPVVLNNIAGRAAAAGRSLRRPVRAAGEARGGRRAVRDRQRHPRRRLGQRAPHQPVRGHRRRPTGSTARRPTARSRCTRRGSSALDDVLGSIRTRQEREPGADRRRPAGGDHDRRAGVDRRHAAFDGRRAEGGLAQVERAAEA